MIRQPTLEQIKDPAVRESLQWILDSFVSSQILQGEFRHYEVAITASGTNQKIPHGLAYTPKDAWITGVSDSAVASLNHTLADSTNIYITTDKACTVRLFVGRYENQ